MGSAVVRDVVPLDREQYLAQPQSTGPSPLRTAAIPGTPSQAPTACTWKPTYLAISITAIPIALSVTIPRCDSGFGT